MTKVATIVSAALRKLRVIDPDMNPEPRQYEIAVEELNKMMAEWAAAPGIAIGWVAVTDPDDDLPSPQYAENAITLNLAVRLRAEFGVNLDPDIEMRAREALSIVFGHQVANTFARLSYDLPCADAYATTSAVDFYAGN